eukprot:TRINITY_DN2061_c3_g1_i1.p1 TRINITY_DN2061_c3_g1~~TRINITY_DN2061_c3_g1_i1.p1  ORF type:complete len:111 (+),score=16.07 TRINITY_DN2061_c3_g1_i1:38-334(+)
MNQLVAAADGSDQSVYAAVTLPLGERSPCRVRSKRLESAMDEEALRRDWLQDGSSVMRGGAILGLRSKEMSPVQALLSATDDLEDCDALPLLFSLGCS